MRALGIDAGASSTRWAVLEGERVLASGSGGPLTGHLFDERSTAAELVALGAVLEAARPHAPETALAGVTGLERGNEAAKTLEAAIVSGLGLPSGRARVVSDMDLAYLAHFRPGAGILVYAGTGAIAYHVTNDGRVLRAGGRGYLISDEGGGFAIGRAALREVTRDLDSGADPGRTELGRLVLEAVGPDWNAMRAHVYGGGRRAVAALAPLVGRAAEAGDPAALAILVSAGRDLADLAAALERRTGSLPVALAGGALRVSSLLERAFRVAWPGEARVQDLSLEVAAARLALELP